MRVGLDARQLAVPTRATARYVGALAAGLASRPDIEPVLFTNRGLRVVPADLREVEQVTSRLSWRAGFDWLAPAWEQMILPLQLRQRRVDLWHATFNYGVPLASPAPSVLTIHDLAQFLPVPKRDALRIPPINWFFYQQFRLSAKAADSIIAVSECTKADIVRMLGVPPHKVHVVYEAPDSVFERIADPAAVSAVLARYGVRPDYIIYQGGLEPRKNVEALLRAFVQVRRQNDTTLVVAGSINNYALRMRALAETLGIKAHVRFLDFVPNNDLVALMNGAAALAYPSWYEGFGLPPLEGMACGIPVICSNSSSLPEVVGDAALLVAPDDVDGLAVQLSAVLNDARLRNDLIGRGTRRVARFSQPDMVANTVAVYERVLSARG